MSRKPKTIATKEEARPALVPKLRFPEFRAAEGWKLESLGSLGSFTRGLTYSSSDVAPQGLLVLRSTNIQDGALVLDKDLVFVGKTCPDTLRLKTGDIVVCMSNGSKSLVGKSAEYFGDYADDLTVGAFCSFYRSSRAFAKLAFQIGSYQKYVADLIAGGNINNLTNTVLEEFAFPVPRSPAEQQKIAECLSSVDELIAAQARKLESLKTHKKGLMQQLFPREGETQPRLRFPEFQNAGAWSEKELGQLISIKGRIGYRGYTVADIVSAGEGAISLSPSNITDAGVLGFDKATYITWAKYHESPEIMVEREQTLLVKTGSTFGKVAYVSDLPQECTVNPQIVVLKPHSIHPYFLFLLVFGELLQTKIRAVVVGGAIPTLSQEAVSKFKIRVPGEVEQHRIATCLSSLDALIAAETHKHAALQRHKRGLMQQLFPTPEEVES